MLLPPFVLFYFDSCLPSALDRTASVLDRLRVLSDDETLAFQVFKGAVLQGIAEEAADVEALGEVCVCVS